MDPNLSIAGVQSPEVLTDQTSMIQTKPALYALLANQQTESSTPNQDIFAVSTSITIICYFIYVGEMCIYYHLLFSDGHYFGVLIKFWFQVFYNYYYY